MLPHEWILKTLNKRSQSQKTIYFLIPLVWNVQNRQTYWQKERCGVREGREGRMENDCYWISFWGDENVLELDNGDGCITLCIYEKKALNCTLKRVNLTICELQCNNTHIHIYMRYQHRQWHSSVVDKPKTVPASKQHSIYVYEMNEWVSAVRIQDRVLMEGDRHRQWF